MKGTYYNDVEYSWTCPYLGNGFSEFVPGGPITLSLRTTYFTDPMPVTGGWYYGSLACTPGTIPRCTGGWGIALFNQYGGATLLDIYLQPGAWPRPTICYVIGSVEEQSCGG